VDMEKHVMEQILAALADVQNTQLQILDRLTKIEDRLTSVENRLTSVEENHIELTDRLSNFQVQTNQNFARLESKVNTAILTMQLMGYTHEAFAQDHKQLARFLLDLSIRISDLKKKLNLKNESPE
jgi:predicted nuclease with TOPRIM domain